MNATIQVMMDTKEGHQPIGTTALVTCVDTLYAQNPQRTREIMIREATKAIDRVLAFYEKYVSGEIEAPPLEPVGEEKA